MKEAAKGILAIEMPFLMRKSKADPPNHLIDTVVEFII